MEITEKLQMCGREQKNKKDQTLLLVHHAQSRSHWCERTVSQTENAHLTVPTSYNQRHTKKKLLLSSCPTS